MHSMHSRHINKQLASIGSGGTLTLCRGQRRPGRDASGSNAPHSPADKQQPVAQDRELALLPPLHEDVDQQGALFARVQEQQDGSFTQHCQLNMS